MAHNRQNYSKKVAISCTDFRRKILVTAIAAYLSGEALANPTGLQVMNGQAKVASQGNTLTITNSANAVLNWRSFSIATHETTRFVQPTQTSSVLNRVTGADPSKIMGKLQSNGRVFLINSNGVLFGADAKVNVAGLVASTLDIDNANFRNGQHHFTAAPNAGTVQNQGTITTPQGGSVYLIGSSVENSGLVQAPNGTVYLAAGREARLVEGADPDLQVVVSAPTDKALNLGEVVSGSAGIYGALVHSSGRVTADAAVKGAGGRVYLRSTRGTTLAADSRTTANGTTGGTITVQGGEGDTLVSGTIEARGSASVGGRVTLTGNRVGIKDSAHVDVSGEYGGGTVLVGGSERGTDSALPKAQATYLGPNASIRADAQTSGDGGQVVLWSNDKTQSYGAISARGGARGGKGGRVETSGSHLEVTQTPDTSAPAGEGGQWLLDPEDILISTGHDENLSTQSPFQPNTNGKSSILNVDTLVSALDNGSEVIIDTTGGSESGLGNIFLSAEIQIPNPATGLTLKANHDIVLSADIQGTPAKPFALTLIPAQSGGEGSVFLNAKLNLGDQGHLKVKGSGSMVINTGNLSVASAFIPSLEIIKGTVDISGEIDLTNLMVMEGNLNLDSDLTIDGTFDWLGGTLSGTGALTTSGITNIGNVDQYSSVYLKDKNWSNTGTVNLNGELHLEGGVASMFDNQSTGQINVNQVATYSNITDSSIQTTKKRFNNAGMVMANRGMLEIGVDGTDTGNYIIGAEATLLFRDSARDFDKGIALTGTKTGVGAFQLSGGTLNLNVAYIQGVGDPSWRMDSGTIHDSLGLTFNDSFSWLGGTLTGAGMLTTSGTTSIGDAQNYSTVYLMGKNWDNTGMVSINGAILFNGAALASLNNQSSGQINVNISNNAPYSSISYLSKAANKSFNNEGTVRVDSGTLEVKLDGTDTGNYVIGAGGMLSFRDCVRNFDAGVAFSGTESGTGTFQLSGGTLNLNVPYIQNAGDPAWRMDSGTLNDSEGLTFNGSFTWLGGTLSGAGTLTTAGSVTIGDGLQLTNKTWNNHGTADINGTFDLIAENKETTFSNTGTLNVNRGTLTTAILNTNEGNLSIASKASLDTQGRDLINAPGSIISGGGTLNLGSGTIFNHGTIHPDGNRNFSVRGNLVQGTEGMIAFDLGDAGNFIFGRLTVSETAKLAGTLNVAGMESYEIDKDDSFRVIAVGGGLSGEFDYTDIPSGIGTVTLDYSLRQVKLVLGSEVLCAADNCWIGGDGNWNDTKHWFYGRVPDANDSVLIRDLNDSLTIIASSAVNIEGLWLDENLTINDGIGFAVNSLFTINNVVVNLGGPSQVGSLVLNGGTLAGAGLLTVTDHFENVGGMGGIIDRTGAVDITQKGGGLNFEARQVGALTLRANSGDVTLGAIQAHGNVDVRARGSATITAVINTGDGNLSVIANNGIVMDPIRIQAGSGNITFSVTDPNASISTAVNSIVTTSGEVTYQADNMELGGIVAVSNNSVNLRTASRSRDIDIGSDQTGDALHLRLNELKRITADTLNIGRTADDGTLYLNTSLASSDINASILQLAKQNISIIGAIGTSDLLFDHHVGISASGDISIAGTGIYLTDSSALNLKASGGIYNPHSEINLTGANINLTAGANIYNLGNVIATRGDIIIKAQKEISAFGNEFKVAAPNGAIYLTSSDSQITTGALSAAADIILNAGKMIDTTGSSVSSTLGVLRLASGESISTGELAAGMDITLSAGTGVLINGPITAGNRGNGIILLRNSGDNDINLAGGAGTFVKTTVTNRLNTDSAIKINSGGGLSIDGMNFLVDGSGSIDLIAENGVYLSNSSSAGIEREISAPGNINITAGTTNTPFWKEGDAIHLSGANVTITANGAIDYPSNFSIASAGNIRLVSNHDLSIGSLNAAGDIKIDAVTGMTVSGPITAGTSGNGLILLRSSGDGDVTLRGEASVKTTAINLLNTDSAIKISSGGDLYIDGMNLLVDQSGGIDLTAKNSVYLNNSSAAGIERELTAPGNIDISAISGAINTPLWKEGDAIHLTGSEVTLSANDAIHYPVDFSMTASAGNLRLVSNADISSGALNAAGDIKIDAVTGIAVNGSITAGEKGNGIILLRNSGDGNIALRGGLDSFVKTTATHLLNTDSAIKINSGGDIYIDGINLQANGSGGIDLLAANNVYLDNSSAEAMRRNISAPGNINITSRSGTTNTSSWKEGDFVHLTGANVSITATGAIHYPSDFSITAGNIRLVSDEGISIGPLNASNDIKIDAVTGILIDRQMTAGGVIILRSTGDGDILLRHGKENNISQIKGNAIQAITDDPMGTISAITINSGRNIDIEGMNLQLNDATVRLTAENDIVLNNQDTGYDISVLGNINITAISGDIRNHTNLTGNVVSFTAGGVIQNSGNITATEGNLIFSAGGEIDTRDFTLISSNGAARLTSSGGHISTGAVSAANAITIEANDGISTKATNASGLAGNTVTLLAGNIIDIGTNITANRILVQGIGVTLNENVMLTASGNRDALVIDAGRGNFYNNVGPDVFSVTNGRWLVYSSTPEANIFSDLVSGNLARWNSTYETVPPDQVTKNGNFYLFALRPTVTIKADAVTRSYDGTDQFGELSYSSSSSIDATNYHNVFVNPDAQDILTGTLAVQNVTKNVGEYAIVQGTLATPMDYLLDFTGNTAQIIPLTLTVANPQVTSRVYDATTTATIYGDLEGIISGDNVNLLKEGHFADKNVGSAKPVITAFSLSGEDALNYSLTQPIDLVADITPAPLTIANPEALNKVYDATTMATMNGDLKGVISGDRVNLLKGGYFADKKVGNAKPVSATFSITGDDADNYSLTQPLDLFADITPAPLTVINPQALNKVYDATATATVNGDLVGIISGDNVNLLNEGTFADKNVGNAKPVSAAFSLMGKDAGNYLLMQPSDLSTDITPAPLIVVNPQALNKTYDATAIATISGDLEGVFSGDDVNLLKEGYFANKNVGSSKPVSTAFALTGKDVDNYSLTQSLDLFADITPAPLTVANPKAINKVYDATMMATVSGDLVGVIAEDKVDLLSSGNFSDKNVGSDKLVISAFSITGEDADNYLLTQPHKLFADITPASVSIDPKALSKVYDATTTATISGDLVGIFSGDRVNLISEGNFSDKNVGSSKLIIPTFSLTGKDANNYSLTQPIDLFADITPAPVTVTNVKALNKVYDATTTATISGDLEGIISGDSTILLGEGNFADKNVGSNKPIVAALSLTGKDAGNYALTQPSDLSADITPALLSINSHALSKVYDATTTVTIISELAGVITGDVVSFRGNGNFSDKNVGSAKSIIAAFSLTGKDAGNYSLTQPSDLSADITPAPLMVSNSQALNKIYDATATATIRGDLVGVISSDMVNLDGGGNFEDKNVGSGKSVIATLILAGKDADNYSLTQPSDLSADITPLTNAIWQGGSGNWSDAVNWKGDVLPETGNVLAVTIPKGGIVTYTKGTTTLDNFSSSGSFILSGGNIGISGDFATAQYTQSGGELTAFNFTVSKSFMKTAGNLIISGNANVTQESGNLDLSELTASAIVLTALNGAVSLTNAHIQNIAGIQQSGNGSVVINHQGPLLITGKVTSTGAITVDNVGAVETTATAPLSADQGISIEAHSPLTVGANITAGGDVILLAGESNGNNDILTVNGDITSTKGRVLLTAGDDIVVASNVKLNAAVGQPVLKSESNNSEPPTENTVKEAENILARTVSDTANQTREDVASKTTYQASSNAETTTENAEVTTEVSASEDATTTEGDTMMEDGTNTQGEAQESKEKDDKGDEKKDETADTDHGQKKKERTSRKKYCN